MSLKSFNSSLQRWQLSNLCLLSGIASSGTKAVMQSQLQTALLRPRLPSKQSRILSIDMGIKNLAFCVLDVDHQGWDAGNSKPRSVKSTAKTTPLRLSAWKRMDLTAILIEQHGKQQAVPKEEQQNSSDADASTPVDTKNLFSPSSLCKAAYTLASTLISYQPTTIIIERQRFRSGGAAAIQEWTVRVNMLESMLWAILETMRHHLDPQKLPGGFPEMYEVSPRMVGLYWLGRPNGSQSLGPASGSELMPETRPEAEDVNVVKKRAFEKKDKIALAKQWIKAAEIESDPQLANLLEAVVSRGSKAAKLVRQKDIGSEVQANEKDASLTGKLDDLADCLVQAVTFTLWEENRRRLLKIINQTQT
ncbi:hypothetical protein M8818_002247 [Zalaria obscura]|uniref:Uncharacterized protein n=1 Tax=Zalaria obscura TaxID=2024903 RepID=A0ACC3SIY4_9PEZI